MYNPTSGLDLSHALTAPPALELLPLPGVFILIIVFFVLAAVTGLFFWWRERRLRRNMQEKIAMHDSRASLELHTIQSQMDPHFIFNSLNAIHSFILSSSTELASSYLTRFSKLMRLTLENSSREWITLEEELESLELYLQLEQLRFDGQFEYVIHRLPDCPQLSVLLPPFVVQPHVQNAIWHRLLHRGAERKGLISIEIGRKDGVFFIKLEDNGVARQSVFHSYQQRTESTRVAAERLHWINTRYHTHAAITTGHVYDQHHQRTGTYTVIRLPDVTAASLPEEAEIFK
ncbi:histidine kinase [Chitinophaga sp. GCM10012297]|uniref:Histidine kinase n=1 Tax=Chitinophaga chungangae TaxID=2821488 RepID=A0ABS3YE58_9BACT|nr:histidine kinase [Chitinophaga chungangae]MBO9152976.1 histidine kinase [Chitinophaga chungangae]